MINHLQNILAFMSTAFLHLWPYLLVTIPLAVAVRLSGASRKISRVFNAQPLVAIFLATAIGAFSPFCSCGIIPIIWSMLAAGVPLAPVMSFWLASPSMDPEIFFLSVSTLGWELAVWRLFGTFLLSLGGGLLAHVAIKRAWLGTRILREKPITAAPRLLALLRRAWRMVISVRHQPVMAVPNTNGTVRLACQDNACSGEDQPDSDPVSAAGPELTEEAESKSADRHPTSPFSRRLLTESKDAVIMVAKFMALALFLEALIVLYVPENWVASLLGKNNPLAIASATLLAVPVYTTNLTALALIGGLLDQGMNPGAALAFLIAGPTTTLPAMVAVWGLATRRVFALYLSVTIISALIIGYAFSW